jgi:Rv2632c-like
MMHTRTWTVTILLTEDDERTRAAAVLRTDVGTEVRHEGLARRNPGDPQVPEIGDELAACRALTGLAQDLLEATVADVEQNIGRGADIRA